MMSDAANNPARVALDAMMAPWMQWRAYAAGAMTRAARRRNTLMDAVLYDMRPLGLDGLRRLKPAQAHAGRLIVAHPSGGRPLTVYDGPASFGASIDATTRIVALAGCGGSPIGAGAMAQAAANALREPAVAVELDYGAEELFDEATGGAYGLFSEAASGVGEAWRRAAAAYSGAQRGAERRDLTAIRALIAGGGDRVRLWIAHGAGVSLLARAMAEATDRRSPPAAPIVAFGSTATFPAGATIYRFGAPPIGFGLGLAAAMRTPTNPRLPGSVDLHAVLGGFREIVAARPPRPITGPVVASVAD